MDNFLFIDNTFYIPNFDIFWDILSGLPNNVFSARNLIMSKIIEVRHRKCIVNE